MPPTVRRWLREAPPGFRYSVKVNQSITHEHRMVRTRKLVKSYYEIAATLGEKMGCFLFQFPPSYHYSAARLKSIITQLDPPHRNVVEFRHKSWWRANVYRAFAERGIGFCAVSAPRLPEEFPAGQKFLYVRLSGKTRWIATIIPTKNSAAGPTASRRQVRKRCGCISTTTAKASRLKTHSAFAAFSVNAWRCQ